MPATPRACTADLNLLTGAPVPAGTVVSFRRRAMQGQAGSIVVPDTITATADADGRIAVTLYPGEGTMQVRGTTLTWQADYSLTEDGSTDLANCIGQAAPLLSNAAELARDAAIAARDAALVAETNAETAEVAAEAAQAAAAASATAAAGSATTATTQAGIATTQAGLATTARTGAETARTGAETARTGAETAQTGAQTARTAAETAQTGAQTARTGAEAARDIALGAQAAAQLAAAAITPMDVLHLVSQGAYTFPVPSGWWDTGLRQTATDSLRGTASTMAIISNWNAEGLRGTGPNVFVLAHDTARIFGADGVTAVSAPGTAVALATDDWQGITSGTEQLPAGTTGLTGTATAASYNTSNGAAQVTRVDSSNQSWVRFAGYTTGRPFLIDLTLTGSINALIRDVATGTTLATVPAGQRSARVVIVPANGNFVITAETTGTLSFTVNSVREITNWPAYQNTAAARPQWGRAPAQVRNLAAGDSRDFVTGWSNVSASPAVATNGTAVADDGVSLVDEITFGPAVNSWWGKAPFASTAFAVGKNFRVSFKARKTDAGADFPLNVFAYCTGSPGGVVEASVTATATWERKAVTLAVPSNWLGGTFFIGFKDTNGNSYGRKFAVDDLQIEIGTVETAIQRRGPSGTDITEAGVTSFGLLSFDGSDDALLHQLTNGGTVAVALFGRGGSYLIPSITLAAPSVLQLGPLSVLDDGVLVSSCPVGILRAVGTVPWSSRFELVNYAIMKANPSAEEQARAMRFFAARGARGWLVEGPELVTNGGFDTNITGWTNSSAGTGTVAWQSGSVRVSTITDFNNRGMASQAISTVAGQLYLLSATLNAASGAVSECSVRVGTAVGLTNVLATQAFASIGQTLRAVFVAQGATSFVALQSQFVAGTADFDNISVRALTPEF